MRSFAALLLATSVVLGSGLAVAGGEVHAGLLHAKVSDGFGSDDCIPLVDTQIASICVFRISQGDPAQPGSWEVYAHENLRYVGVAYDASVLPRSGFFPLLPSDEFRVSFAALRFGNPVFDSLVGDPSEGVRVSGADPFYAGVNETGVFLNYFGPTTRDLYAMPSEHHWTMNWSDGDESDDQGVTWNNVAPITHVGDETDEQSTDTLLTGVPLILLERAAPNEEAYATGEDLLQVRERVTPNVIYGLGFDEVHLTDDPAELGTQRNISGSASGPIGGTVATAPPQSLSEIREPRDPIPISALGVPLPDVGSGPLAATEPTAQPPTGRVPEGAGSLAPNFRSHRVVLGAAAGALALWAIIALYRRIRNEDAVIAETRASILATVRNSPGIRLSNLAQVVGLDRTTVAYHVRVLEAARLIRAHRWRRETRFFEAGVPPASRAAIASAIADQHPVARAIRAELSKEPRISGRRLSAALGIPESTVRWHLARLRSRLNSG